jgi:hypothetical protein
MLGSATFPPSLRPCNPPSIFGNHSSMVLILSALSSDFLDPKRLSQYLHCVTGPLFGVRTYTLPDTLSVSPSRTCDVATYDGACQMSCSTTWTTPRAACTYVQTCSAQSHTISPKLPPHRKLSRVTFRIRRQAFHSPRPICTAVWTKP